MAAKVTIEATRRGNRYQVSRGSLAGIGPVMEKFDDPGDAVEFAEDEDVEIADITPSVEKEVGR